MVLVQKANVQLQIKENELKRYLADGYVEVGKAEKIKEKVEEIKKEKAEEPVKKTYKRN